MKMRATLGQGFTDVRVLMNHPMETGQRKDSEGKLVVDAQISQAVSRNPVFSFRLKGGAKGDKIEVAWTDNKGESNSTQIAVA